MQNDFLRERYELVIGRIREIPGEDPVPERYRNYFLRQAEFLKELDRIFCLTENGRTFVTASEGGIEETTGAASEGGIEETTGTATEEMPGRSVMADGVASRTAAACIADHEAIYAEIRDHYAESFANPAFAKEQFGERAGRLLSFLAAELRSGIACAYEGRAEEWTILLELFAEIYSCFLEEPADLQEVQQTIYWHFHDYSRLFAENQIRGLVCPEENFFADIIMHADLTDLKYLYRYGLPVGDNEKKIAAFLNSLPEEQIQAMADTYTEGYRIGFEVTGKDLSKKKTVSIHYAIGFERMIRAAIRNFEVMGLKPTIAREPVSSFSGIGTKRGAYATSINRQYEYDHREDRALYFDKASLEHRLQALKQAYENHEEEAGAHAGPAVLEVFGEAPFSPQAKESTIRFSESQQQLLVYQMSQAGQLSNQFIPGEERSFTIIAYPMPEIAGADAENAEERFREIFRETVKINTLDYALYQRMQQALIDVLDQAEHVEIRGKNDNETNLTVKICPLSDPAEQTAFENCVADVNIPVGEVFTSPVLAGTNGLLHVSEVFLNGLQFRDLKVAFTDGMVTDYSCANFTDPEEGRKYIRENVLMHHDTLPMGEFAIGTNTTAYRMAKTYGIADKLPILIAEKTGPHFAVGDTCYSHAEDTAVFNPDGKEIIARDNAISIRRKETPETAYFNCHTDITIPFDELGAITVVSSDGTAHDIIRDGIFVVPGTELLNVPLLEA